MAATPHPRPAPDTTATTPLAPLAYNNAERAGRTHGEGVSENWKPQEGKIVAGKFRLIQQLGGSDHSVVFLTERTEEPKKAVIKLLPAVNTEDQILHWKLDTKLPHPHLLRIFEAGKCELNGQPLMYVVMEYAEEDLSQVLPQRALTAAEAREMLLPALDALSFLHGKGFVHGGIKPANILAISDQLKLSSDSIAAISEGITVDGAKAVTAYDPPEAKLGKVSPASDVWSLGVTLTEVLTQQKPVWGAAKKQEPALPKELDESFRILIRNCLRPDAASRWTIAEIKSLLQPEKPPAAKVTRPYRSSVWFYLVPIIVLLAFGFVITRTKNSTVSPHDKSKLGAVAGEKSSPSESTQRRPSQKVTNSGATASRPNPSAAAPVSSVPPKVRPAAAQNPGSVLQQVLPNVPESASRTITGKVRVRVKVLVDAAGNVTAATLDDPGPSKYFARLSLQAAEKWKFNPVQVNGRPAPSEWLLHFAYGSSSTDCFPKQIVH